MIFVNFKAYEESTGERALSLVKQLENVALESMVKVIPVVSPSDIKEICSITRLEVWSQKIDPVEYGAHTGSILAEAVFEDGATGTFLNHSEARLSLVESLKKAKERADAADLKTLIFAKDLEELRSVCDLHPTFAAYEPPEFIGRSDISVASAEPEIIAKASIMTKEAGIPLIVGAGIHSEDDVRKSLELGAVGIAVASAIVTSPDPSEELKKLIRGFE